MRRRTVTIFTLALAAVLAAPYMGEAHHLDSTAWNLAGTDKLTVSRGKHPLTTPVPASSPATLAFDASSAFTVVFPFVAFGGTYVDKGKRGFTGTVDQAALSAISGRLTSTFIAASGATSVDVTNTTVTISGKVSKNGQKLTFKMKAVVTGTATIDGVQKAGHLTEKGTYKGSRAS